MSSTDGFTLAGGSAPPSGNDTVPASGGGGSDNGGNQNNGADNVQLTTVLVGNGQPFVGVFVELPDTVVGFDGGGSPPQSGGGSPVVGGSPPTPQSSFINFASETPFFFTPVSQQGGLF